MSINLDAFPAVRRADGVLHYLIPDPKCALCDLPLELRWAATGKCRTCAIENRWASSILQRILAVGLYIPHPWGLLNSPEIDPLKRRGEGAALYAGLMAQRAAAAGWPVGSFDLIVPVPPTTDPRTHSPEEPARQTLAGSVALAAQLSDLAGVPWREELWYSAPSTSQRGKNRAQRHANRQDVMSTRSTSLPPRVLITDDVCTSGASLFEAARALGAAGVEVAVGLVAARDDGLDFLPSHLKQPA